jgi:hypothetical protein
MLVSERRFEMTNTELWLINLWGMTLLCSFLFYVIQLANY